MEPNGPPGCKRILLSNDYSPTLDRPSVDVVTAPITRVLPHALRTADGAEHPADTIIWGTGFRATEFLVPMTVTGANLGHNSVVYMIVQRGYVRWVQDRIARTVWESGCTNWYRTASGRNTNNWPDFTFAYRARTRRFDPADYRAVPAA